MPLLPVISPATTCSVIAQRATLDADGNPTLPVLEQGGTPGTRVVVVPTCRGPRSCATRTRYSWAVKPNVA
jgi:hypothetical protein